MATTGTGGHLFPAMAIGEAIRERGGHEIWFVTSGLGPEREVLDRHGFRSERIQVGKLKGETCWKKLETLAELPGSVWSSRRLLKRLAADVVLGSGGHTSAPVVMAAWLLGLTRAVFEQNAVPGLTNRLLARCVDRVYTGFRGTERWFPRSKTLWSGVPVRSVFGGVGPKREGEFVVLVLGGSQGAVRLNRAMLDAFPVLAGRSIRVIHQTGRADYENVKKGYAALGAASDRLQMFPFIEKMEAVYRQSNLVISRAGASTLAELVAVSRPALLVPYPYAADDHQRVNALKFAEAGAAEVILDRELTGEDLAKRVLRLAQDPPALSRMAEAMGGFPGRGAAETIAEDLISLAKTGEG